MTLGVGAGNQALYMGQMGAQAIAGGRNAEVAATLDKYQAMGQTASAGIQHIQQTMLLNNLALKAANEVKAVVQEGTTPSQQRAAALQAQYKAFNENAQTALSTGNMEVAKYYNDQASAVRNDIMQETASQIHISEQALKTYGTGIINMGIKTGDMAPVTQFLNQLEGDTPLALMAKAMKKAGVNASPGNAQVWLAGQQQANLTPDERLAVSDHQGQLRYQELAGQGLSYEQIASQMGKEHLRMPLGVLMQGSLADKDITTQLFAINDRTTERTAPINDALDWATKISQDLRSGGDLKGVIAELDLLKSTGGRLSPGLLTALSPKAWDAKLENLQSEITKGEPSERVQRDYQTIIDNLRAKAKSDIEGYANSQKAIYQTLYKDKAGKATQVLENSLMGVRKKLEEVPAAGESAQTFNSIKKLQEARQKLGKPLLTADQITALKAKGVAD